MDFDNPKVYGDTFISDGLVSLLLPFLMLKNAFKKHPLQNRTNVQIKGGGVKGLLNNVQKNCTFLTGGHPLCIDVIDVALVLY